MTATDPGVDREPPPKTTLFCPDCGHPSRYDGDWRVVESGSGARYLCPTCRTEITVRGSDPTQRPPRAGVSPWQQWRAAVRAWKGMWRRLLAP